MTEETGHSPFEQTREHIKRTSTWLRGFYIILFAILFYVAEIVISAVVVFQFLHTLLTGKTNRRLLTLGQALSTYAYQILTYISYNSDDQPYPFSAWPKGAPTAGARKTAAKKKTSDPEAPDNGGTPPGSDQQEKP